jgi:hypothetical protein
MTLMSATVHFSIKYDGPALMAHEMDVRELAPALIALSGLLEHANKAAFPDSSEVRVNVQGRFKGGSFGIDLTAVQSIADQVVAIFSGPAGSAAANLATILQGLGLTGGAAGGLIAVIKWLRGRKPHSIRLEGDSTVFEIGESESIETFSADLITGRLYKSRIVRQSLAKVLKPLERDGIDSFVSGRDGVAETLVTKADLRAFEVAASEEDIVSNTLSEAVLLEIESAVFKEDNKWRFNDGATSFFAVVADAGFMARIESGDERFGKGDVLVVDLRRIQSINENGLKLEYVLERVREHRAPLQSGLFRL